MTRSYRNLGANSRYPAWARFSSKSPLHQPAEIHLPPVFIEPTAVEAEEDEVRPRVEPPTIAVAARQKSFREVELPLSAEHAIAEARVPISRCRAARSESTRSTWVADC
jgi:hypothetical protein